VRLLQPLGVEAALQAIETRTVEANRRRRQLELALERARYEAALARRQYDAVDPDNRLVAGELERRWNTALAIVQEREGELETLERQQLEAHRVPSCPCRWRCLRSGADSSRIPPN
jgi:hypothetical protein